MSDDTSMTTDEMFDTVAQRAAIADREQRRKAKMSEQTLAELTAVVRDRDMLKAEVERLREAEQQIERAAVPFTRIPGDLRDWFAGQALAGVWAGRESDYSKIESPLASDVAKSSYKIADAMIEQSANIDLAWHPCNPSTDELRKAFEEVKKLTSAVSRLDYVRARKRGVKPMNELIKRLRDVGNTFKSDYATATLADDAADALTAADTRHDDDQRAHALLEQAIVWRDDKIKREADDWAETDTSIRKAAATVLGDKVHGDSKFVPPAADVVDMIVVEVERLRAENPILRESFDEACAKIDKQAARITELEGEVKRLRKIEDASAGLMLNLELARAEVRRLRTPNTLAAEQHHQIVQLKGEVERLQKREGV